MRKWEREGYEAGRAAGSWVIDGNTSRETCERILQGYEDGDPEIMDMQPSPLSGEWADESIPEIFGKWPTDQQMQDYEDGYSRGFWREVLHSARVQVA